MTLKGLKQFRAETISAIQCKDIRKIAQKARKDIIKMIMVANSGHLGGSLSSIDIYTVLWLCGNIKPSNVSSLNRDRIVISHGHTAPGIYAVLGNMGFFDVKDAIMSFRKRGSIFEGHPNNKVPGVEWCSGSLGQGLSVGCGFALAAKIKGLDYHVFVVMGDGEQQKGQITEAMELVSKYKLNNLTLIIDFNGMQASGETEKIMPQNILKKYKAAGWAVFQIDGHNYREIYKCLRKCYKNIENQPSLILARTIMGKGVSFIENNYKYHGKVLSKKQSEKALEELDDNNGDVYKEIIEKKSVNHNLSSNNNRNIINNIPLESKIKYGKPVIYNKGEKIACRTAFGNALLNIVKINKGQDFAVIDCDLAESLRIKKLWEKAPKNFIECGIQEHNAATVAGALSKAEVLTFFADFGVFGIDETYNQHRMNDLNETSIKLICTHNGLDVGKDGKTHQCIDYLGLMSNLFNFKLIVPADANQTDKVIRYVATHYGNFVVMMGRSKLPVLTNNNHELMYSENYKFQYGEADWVRRGNDATIITYGTMVYRAVWARQKLCEKGIKVGVLNMSCPVDIDIIKLKEAAKTGLIITYEDHHIDTGIGKIIGTIMVEKGVRCRFRRVGITQYGISAKPEEQYRLQNIDKKSLVKIIKHELE